MPCPDGMNTVANLTGEDVEHVPIDMELTCTAPQDSTLMEQVTGRPDLPRWIF